MQQFKTPVRPISSSMIVNEYGKLIDVESDDQLKKHLAKIKDINVPTLPARKPPQRYDTNTHKKKLKEAEECPKKVFCKERICMEILYGKQNISKGFEAAVVALGGEFLVRLTKNCTVFVTNDKRSPRIERAKLYGIPTVSLLWLTQSMDRKEKQDYGKYMLDTETISTQKAERVAKHVPMPAYFMEFVRQKAIWSSSLPNILSHKQSTERPV